MKILVYRWDIYPYEKIIDSLNRQGHHTDVLAFPVSNHICDKDFALKLEKKLSENAYDFVFSVNFYAVIAETCFHKNIRYAAWTCDTPLLSMLHPSVSYPTSFIFTFDRYEYDNYKEKGHSNIFYLPLAGIHTAPSSREYLYDISFVGSMYEKNRYEEMCEVLPEKLTGYMDALIEAAKRTSGGNLIRQMLTDDILSDISNYVSIEGEALPEDALRIHFETAVLSYKVASDTRTDALWLLSQNHTTHLFTSTPPTHPAITELSMLKNLTICPPVDYNTELPNIFSRSKINLNFTIPNIKNGIPLRIFDILSSGGFLLTDRREVLSDLFEDGIDLVTFDGMADMIKKADYYLAHPSERERIARNGMKKVHNLHTYDIRLKKIIKQMDVR